MNERIRELLMSENNQDVELGLIIARQQNIDPVEVGMCYVDNYYNRRDKGFASQYVPAFTKYMEITDIGGKTPNGGEYHWVYNKWKEDE